MKENSLPTVADTDNHEQHLIVHRMAKKTWATWAHIGWHEDLLAQQKAIEQAQAQIAAQQGQQESPLNSGLNGLNSGQSSKKPQVGGAKQKPNEAAAPLKQEMVQKGNNQL